MIVRVPMRARHDPEGDSLAQAKALVWSKADSDGGRADFKLLHMGLCGATPIPFPTGWEQSPLPDDTAVSLRLKRLVTAPPPRPRLVDHVAVLDENRYAAVDIISRQLVCIGADGATETAAPDGCGPVSSLRPLPDGGFLALETPGQRILDLAPDLSIRAAHVLPDSVAATNPDRVCPTPQGPTVISTRKRSVIFLDTAMRPRATIRVDHFSLLDGARAWGQGVVAMEWMTAKMDYGELVLVTDSGPCRPLAGGFCRPSDATPVPGGLLVCDLAGLHRLDIQGGNVIRRRCLPWRPLMDALGLGPCLGQEAFVHGGLLHVKFKLVALRLPQSRSYAIAGFEPLDDAIVPMDQTINTEIP